MQATRVVEMFSVERRQLDGLVELHLKGEIDLSNVTELSREIEEARAVSKRILIDLAQLDFIDSSGLGALIEATETARLNGQVLTLRRGENPEVRRIFEITGLDRTLPFV